MNTKRIATFAAVLLVGGIAVTACASSPALAPTGDVVATTAAPTKAASTKAAPSNVTRDGSFEFTVTKVKTGVKVIGSGYLTQKPQGQYTLVTMTVKNIGDQMHPYADSDQQGVTTNGSQVSADPTASMYMGSTQTAFANINPGNHITTTVVFDIPKDQKVTKVVVHDSSLSDGATLNIG